MGDSPVDFFFFISDRKTVELEKKNHYRMAGKEVGPTQ